jgi:AraC family transcriptional regulator
METALSARSSYPVRQAKDFFELKPHEVRLSSRALGWGPLNFERREPEPAEDCLPHGSRQHLIFLSLGGGRVWREMEGVSFEYELAPGYVAIQPGEVPVCWSWDTRLNYSVIGLDPAFLEGVAQRVFGLEPGEFRLLPGEREHDPVISNIAGVLAREAARADAGSALYAESLANILAVHLLRDYALKQVPERGLPTVHARQSDASRPVMEAIRHMQRHYAREITLSELAARVHLSPFHLARRFKQTTGMSPHQYLIEMRVNAARALLEAGSGQRSLAEIAAAVGFADQSHLTRHFKRRFGVTPSEARGRHDQSRVTREPRSKTAPRRGSRAAAREAVVAGPKPRSYRLAPAGRNTGTT